MINRRHPPSLCPQPQTWPCSGCVPPRTALREGGETSWSGEIGITHDNGANKTTPGRHGTLYRNILYLDGTPLNIEIGGEVLARGREVEGEPAEEQAIRPGADNTMGGGLIKSVTMLKENNP